MARSLLVFSVLLVSIGCSDVDKKPVIPITAGVDYYVINPPLAKHPLSSALEPLDAEGSTTTPEKIEVVDVFWFGCNSCYLFRDTITPWLKEHADDIDYAQMPAPLNPIWTTHARIYLAARQLHVAEQVSNATYEHLHVKREKLYTDKSVRDFFERFGIDKQVFALAYKGNFTNNQVLAIRDYLGQARIRSVPALIIDGRFVVLENNRPNRALAVASVLIAKIQDERSGQ